MQIVGTLKIFLNTYYLLVTRPRKLFRTENICLLVSFSVHDAHNHMYYTNLFMRRISDINVSLSCGGLEWQSRLTQFYIHRIYHETVFEIILIPFCYLISIRKKPFKCKYLQAITSTYGRIQSYTEVQVLIMSSPCQSAVNDVG